MGLIAIEGMEFHAYHGYYEEERRVGGRYSVDVYVETDFSRAAVNDDLEKTINYEVIYDLVRVRMEKKTKLIETIAADIMAKIKSEFPSIESLRVRVNKFEPPLPGKVARTYIELDQDFRKTCSKCGTSFLCYRATNCWCQAIELSKKTQERLNQQYLDCLCSNCLKTYQE